MCSRTTIYFFLNLRVFFPSSSWPRLTNCLFSSSQFKRLHTERSRRGRRVYVKDEYSECDPVHLKDARIKREMHMTVRQNKTQQWSVNKNQIWFGSVEHDDIILLVDLSKSVSKHRQISWKGKKTQTHLHYDLNLYYTLFWSFLAWSGDWPLDASV